MFREWQELPHFMKTSEVRPYWAILRKRRLQILFKRIIDLVLASILFVVFFIPMIVIALLVTLDSPGPVFFRQKRVTSYGKIFCIHKFRTMVNNADRIGTSVTASGDNRITRIGKFLRRYRLDELPQLIDVIKGDMSFVGTRPEVLKYVDQYKPEYYATLLLPAGITSEASIKYKDEDSILEDADNIDDIYINKVLPSKMKLNLESLRKFSIIGEIKTMIRTIIAVIQ